MQSFILDRHTDPSNPTMKVTQDDKIPIYDSKAAAEADLANIEEGGIVATKDTGATEKVVDVVQDGNMNPVTSNAVADFLTPDYSNAISLSNGVATTMTKSGWVYAKWHGGNSIDTTSLSMIIMINTDFYWELNKGTGSSEHAFVATSPLIPVKKGDVVKVTVAGTWTGSIEPGIVRMFVPNKAGV